MKLLNELVCTIIRLRQMDRAQITLLAVCPNSDAVLEAAVLSAAANNAPMLFAATLNQVDRDGGYTGWTQAQFVNQMHDHADQIGWDGPLYPCLDHGGPWLKDHHTLDGLSFDETMHEVKLSITACLEAGYNLLHIDPTVDRLLAPDEHISVEVVVDRTVELVAFAEQERKRLNLPQIAYEVGTEEVHGGLVDIARFNSFIKLLRSSLISHHLDHAWPCFVVAQVGTDLHTTYFDPSVSHQLYEIVSPLGSLIKGHYTDGVENPADYPITGMGGANVGPEFTSQEYKALRDLSIKEMSLCQNRPEIQPSSIMTALEEAVLHSGRWKKWLQPKEERLDFYELEQERRDWLVQTGARYIWSTKGVVKARNKLYENLSQVIPDPHQYVVNRIVHSIDKYIRAFNLFDALSILEETK